MNLLQWPENRRPREKLIACGAQGLSDAELVAILLRKGVKGANAVELSLSLLERFGSINGLLSANKHEFCAVRGLGVSTFVQLQAMLEVARRYYTEMMQNKTAIENASDTRTFLLSQLRDEPSEVFAVMLLNSQHHLIAFEKMFYGTINCAQVHPRVILQRALEKNAGAIILAHNHPSGIAEPSQSDRQITQRIIETMSLVDIRVLDHFVIGAGHTVSFAERGWL